MKINVLAVGKTSNAHIEALLADYMSRLKRYCDFECLIVPDANSKQLSEAQIKRKEGENILKKLPLNAFIMLLDERGKQMRSVQLAQFIAQRQQNYPNMPVCFLIGGAYGFDSAVYQRAHEQLALSQLTFNHQMVRLFALEQLYRAFTIINNEPYHHE